MDIGITFRIEVEGIDESISCILIGIENEKYLIIRIPTQHNLDIASHMFIKGNEIYVKYVYKGTIFGFQSKIIDQIYEPFKLLFIEYPEKIESYDFRGNKRVECYLPAFVIVEEVRIEGCITDISKAGCLFDIKIPELENCKSLIDSNEEINIGFQLPGVEEALNIVAKQRSLKNETNKARIGIEFVFMKGTDKSKLSAFLSNAN
ncbi:MAG: flagellar brake protein [Candidatus Brocadiaceae bacterium]|nr:flagellar brake protein [Candidatus Brocadiaceae bacterium]